MVGRRVISFVVVGLAALRAAPAQPAVPRGTEILWDTYGVPHIIARDRAALAWAFGWAQMRNHADLLLRLIAQARGRAAELLGPEYLDDDRAVWRLELPLRARDMEAAQHPAMRAHVAAFVAGINAFARAHPELVGDSVRPVLPVTPTDIYANAERLLYLFFLTSDTGPQVRAWEAPGSNAWAIAPSRTADHHTMVLQNPHLPWGDIFTWMEAQEVAPGVNLSGAALVGAPVLQIAFNDDLAWTHTVNTQDGTDLFELTLAPGGYRWHGGVRRFATRTRVLVVRDRMGGPPRRDTLRIERAIPGVIVATRGTHALALRVVGLDGPPLPWAFEQWWNMGRARTFAQFLAAIRPNQIPGQNITYGDRAGHIMMFWGAASPVRPRGDWTRWAGIIDADSVRPWTALQPFDALPRVVDPRSGWVQNANDGPWFATWPPMLDPRRYPASFGPYALALRPQRSIQMLDSAHALTFEQLIIDKHSTRLLLADRVLPELLETAQHSRSERARAAAEVLARWDRAANADSRGAVLFTTWWSAYGRLAATSRFRDRWRIDAPLTTPAGLGAPSAAVDALDSAARVLQSAYGSLDVPWGEVYRLQRDTVDLPSNGAPGALGAFRVMTYQPMGHGRYAAGVSGDSYVGAIEFSRPLRAMTLVGYGNASRAGSPHRVDQLTLYARQQLKPAWRARDSVMAHLELRERF